MRLFNITCHNKCQLSFYSNLFEIALKITFYYLLTIIQEKNDFAEGSKIVLDTEFHWIIKIILLKP